MKTNRLFIVISFLLLCKATISQEYICTSDNGNFYVVTAKGSLNLRESSEKDSKILASIPEGEIIYCCGDTKYMWLNTFYKGKEGAVSANYLRLYEYQPHILLPELGKHLVSEVKQGDEYIGIYRNEKDEESFYLKKVIIKYKKEQAMWDGAKDSSFIKLIFEDKKPLFLFKGIPIKNLSEKVYGKYFGHKFVFPGEFIPVKLGEKYSSIYALGNVITNEQKDKGQIFKTIKNYEVRNQYYSNETINDYLIFKDNYIYYYGDNFIISRHLIWAGDLDKDQKIDYLFWLASDKGACMGISFHLSSWAEKGNICRQVSYQGYCGD